MNKAIQAATARVESMIDSYAALAYYPIDMDEDRIDFFKLYRWLQRVNNQQQSQDMFRNSEKLWPFT
ncbi:MAG: hypothetical protein ABW155_08220 [Candidatus Thiodiazotropha sp.]